MSKPPETKESRRRRDYRTVFSTRKRDGVKEPKSPKIAGWEPAESTRAEWIDCKQDRDEVARILKGGAK